MTSDSVVIVAAKRTPMGGFQGELAGLSAVELGAAAIRAAIEEGGVDAAAVDQAVMGCVLPAGLGQAPARQAALGAGLPLDVACVTINKMCGSGMKAVMDAHDQIVAGSADIMVAGGMESMSNAPYLLAKARAGYRMGHGAVIDHMFLDGLEDAYDRGRLMGTFAEDTARHYQFTREDQDQFAIRSTQKAQKAIASGWFTREVTPVSVAGRGGSTTVGVDEQPGKARLDKIPMLKPAFAKDGTVTAASSSSISDGAAALLLMRESQARAGGHTPLARILGHASHAQASAWFTTAPIKANGKLLAKLGMSASDIDLFEINEAFAVVTLAAIRDLGLDPDTVNVHGGACALGHPIGASGARILVTLLSALRTHDKTLGIASLCIGGGEATAVAIERLN